MKYVFTGTPVGAKKEIKQPLSMQEIHSVFDLLQQEIARLLYTTKMQLLHVQARIKNTI